MVGYVTVGTNDLGRAMAFYDALFGAVGIPRLWAHGNLAAWGRSRDDVAFCVARPFDGAAATAGNGAMVALRMASRADVDTLHAQALALGGSDEGAAGPRGSHGFYGGYFRDLDGNKLTAYVPGG